MTLNQLRLAAIATLGLVGVITFTVITGRVNTDTGVPDPLVMDGRTITFTYTDDNTDENLILYTDQMEYTNGLSHAEMYVAVVNKDKKQDVELTAYFSDDDKQLKSVWVATEVTRSIPEPVMEEQCQPDTVIVDGDNIATTTCIWVQTGTSTRQTTNQVWSPLDLFTRADSDKTKSKKDVGAFLARKKSSSFEIDENQVLYYKVLIEFPEGMRDEVLLEAHGSKGGYGLLR